MLRSAMKCVGIPELLPASEFEENDTGTTTFPNNDVMKTWNEIRTYSIEFVHDLSGSITYQQQLVSDFLEKYHVCVGIWNRFKCVKLGHHVPQYNYLPFLVLYAGDKVYGRFNRHDGVVIHHGGEEKMGLIEALFGNYDLLFSTDLRLALIWVLNRVDPDKVNCSIVNVFGHKRLRYVLYDGGHNCSVLVDSRDWIGPLMVVIDGIGWNPNTDYWQDFKM